MGVWLMGRGGIMIKNSLVNFLERVVLLAVG